MRSNCLESRSASETATACPKGQGVFAAIIGKASTFLIGIALLAVYLLWGATYLSMRIALQTFPPFFVAALRFLLAGSLLYAFLRMRGVPPPTAREWKGYAQIGTLMALCVAGVVFAEQWVSSGVAAVAVAAIPLWVALLSGIGGDWPSRQEAAGLFVGFCGILLLNREESLRANPIGAIALILATLSWAAGSLRSQRLSLPNGLMASAAEMLTGGSVVLLLSILRGEHAQGTPTVASFWAMTYLILGGSLVAFSAYTFLLGRVRPAVATSYAYVNPVVAMGIGIVFAGERFTLVGMVAMGLILASVALVMARRNAKH